MNKCFDIFPDTLYSHPDKVKLGVNDTVEAVEAKFVELTKAYKAYVTASCMRAYIDQSPSLTDETIRKNLRDFGHPDGRQEVSMGIALPKWVVESSNNIWVLGAYGLLFGGALPALVVSHLSVATLFTSSVSVL